MILDNITGLRLINQQISGSKYKSVKQLVSAMGAMQAQDYNAVKWAVGVRLPDSTEKNIESAFNKGDIIRTHLLRPTWHFVSAEDIYWMLELTAPRILPSLKTRHKNLELTTAIFNICFTVIEKALTGGKHLTREEITSELAKVKISTKGIHTAHILMQAELECLICSGSINNKNHTYSLLEERVPQKIKLTKDESLAKLALKYFTSRGPATVQDFSWWSGMSLTESKHALELNKLNLVSEKSKTFNYWFSETPQVSPKKDSVYLLPAYDEFLISYRDRSSSIPQGIKRKIISNNGIFWPVVVLNGQVCGVWKRATHKNKLCVQVNLFQPHSDKIKKLIELQSAKFSRFLNKQIEVMF